MEGGIINYNLMALNMIHNLSGRYSHMSSSVRRLSSGLRASGAWNTAGLSIRELTRADRPAFHQGMCNANNAISMIQTAR